MAEIAFFECSRCRTHLKPDGPGGPRTVCPLCAGVLYVRYDMAAVRRTTNRGRLPMQPATMWRYAPMLPTAAPVTLGEGFTPLLVSRENPAVLIKDESRNPTGTIKDRGLSLAISLAHAHGHKKLALYSSGPAANALAAYAAAAGIEAHVFLPEDVSRAILTACAAHGAGITLAKVRRRVRSVDS